MIKERQRRTFGRGIWESPLNTPSTSINNDINELRSIIYPNPAKEHRTVMSEDSDLLIVYFH